jgi:hypothetical protein
MEVGTPTRRFSVAGERDSGPADLHKIADLIDAVSRSIRWSRASDRPEDAHQNLAADLESVRARPGLTGPGRARQK